MTTLHSATVARFGRAAWRAFVPGLGIRSGPASPATRPTPRADHQVTDGIETAIAQLTVTAGIVRRLVASAAAAGDCVCWAAANDADHAIHLALIVLEDIQLPANALVLDERTTR